MSNEDKIVAAIDRNTEAIKHAAYQRTGDIQTATEGIGTTIAFAGGAIWVVLFFIMLTIGCPRAKAARLFTAPVSDAEAERMSTAGYGA